MNHVLVQLKFYIFVLVLSVTLARKNDVFFVLMFILYSEETKKKKCLIQHYLLEVLIVTERNKTFRKHKIYRR